MDKFIPFALIFFEPETTDDGSLLCVSSHSENYGHSRTIAFNGNNLVLWADWETPIKSDDKLIFISWDGEKVFPVNNYKQQPVDPEKY